MPKARNIHESFWDDTDVARLTRDERLLLVGMITCLADDHGRFPADPAYIRKRIFGYDDDLSRADVERLRNSVLEKCRNVRLYRTGGQDYIAFVKWETWQQIRYKVPSKLPEYEETDDITEEITGNSGNLPQTSANSLHARDRVGLGRVELGRVGESAPQSAAKPPAPKKKKPTEVPDDFSVTPTMRTWFKGHKFPFDIELETENFLAWCRANGKTYIDHEQAWQNWMIRESKNPRRPINGIQATEQRRLTPEQAVTRQEQGLQQRLDALARRKQATGETHPA